MDPYKVLGVSYDATEDEIKKHIGRSAASIIRMPMSENRIRKNSKKSSKRFSRHTA